MNEKIFRLAVVTGCVAVAGSSFGAVDSSISTIITNTGTTITDIVALVLTAGAAVLAAMVGLRALPWAYRKIVGFFK
jgi:hypothetical protein